MREYFKLTKGRVAILSGACWVVVFMVLFSQQESYAPKDLQIVYGLALGCVTYVVVLLLVTGWMEFND